MRTWNRAAGVVLAKAALRPDFLGFSKRVWWANSSLKLVYSGFGVVWRCSTKFAFVFIDLATEPINLRFLVFVACVVAKVGYSPCSKSGGRQ